ncbi:hypothetical protein [Massilia alkalitolerans]|uniref:hypothetical protein n=1 Tax=Massilia alkalitolerans TaxID=286638 RepID=UPI0012EBF550|nr:hypothetical protein [Massilia alkalitolerans]
MNKSSTDYQKVVNEQTQGTGESPPPAACLGGKLQWETKELSLDIPQFRSKVQKWSTKIPEMKMETRTYTVPREEIKCENRTVGWRPVFRCSGGLIPSCSTKMEAIVTRVCWPEVHRKEIKMGVPTVTMKNKEISMSIPEMLMTRKDFSFKYPKFYAGEGCIGGSCQQVCEDITQRRIDEQQATLDQATQPAAREMAEATNANFTCLASNMQLQRKQLADSYESWINVATQTLEAMLKEGLTEAAAEQSKAVTQMKAERDIALKNFDAEIQKMATEQKLAAEHLSSLGERAPERP